MGTAGISLTHATMSPKSLIFLDLTERKLIVQTAIYHFEDYPGSPVTLKELNVLLAAVIWARIPQRHEDQGGFWCLARGGCSGSERSGRSPRRRCLRVAAALCGWARHPERGERAWASP